MATTLFVSGCTTLEDLAPGTKERKAAQQDYLNSIDQFGEQQKQFDSAYDSRPGSFNEGQYRLWLDTLSTEAAELDDTSQAAINSGQEYLRHLKEGDAEYLKVLENETSIKKAPVDARIKIGREQAYVNYKLNVTATEQEKARMDSAFSGRPDTSSSGAYRTWTGSLKDAVDAYANAANSQIESGRAYMQYLDQGSAEYNTISSQEQGIRLDINDAQQRYTKEQVRSDYLTACGRLSEQDTKIRKIYEAVPESSKQEEYWQWLVVLKGETDEYLTRSRQEIAATESYMRYVEPGSSEYISLEDDLKLVRSNAGIVKENYNYNAGMYNSYYLGNLPLIS